MLQYSKQYPVIACFNVFFNHFFPSGIRIYGHSEIYMNPGYSFFLTFLFFITAFRLTGQFSDLIIEKDKISYTLADSVATIVSVCSDGGHPRLKTGSDGLLTTIVIDNLAPSTKVTVCIMKDKNGIITEEEKVFMTKSQSTGQIKVFFNRPVDTTFRKASYAPTGTDFGTLQAELRSLIRGAQQSIDIAAYNVNELFFVNELIDANNRGVRVRYITDDETSNTALSGGVPFPVVRGNEGSGLMHNKFIIVDEDSAEDSWVVMGSMNFTSNQMRRDPNHFLFIQDQSLAKAYVLEFEEMWGGEGVMPDPAKARFGSDKTRNTPTQFVIGNVPAELFFSPSDKTTEQIARVIEGTKETLNLALMIFTNWELRDKVVNKTSGGVKNRWIVDDVENSAQVMSSVQSAGGEVVIHSHPDIFHHKYAIADENTENPVLITGSHNWTFSAETRNDENTLIFYDKGLANIFRQEYEARWQELTSFTEDVSGDDLYVFPNPSTGEIRFSRPVNEVILRDLQGNILVQERGSITTLVTKLVPGMYFCHADHKIMKVIVQH